MLCLSTIVEKILRWKKRDYGKVYFIGIKLVSTNDTQRVTYFTTSTKQGFPCNQRYGYFN